MKPRLAVPAFNPSTDGNVFVWVLKMAAREREHQATCTVQRASAMWHVSLAPVRATEAA